MKGLTVLSAGYPLAPVRDDTAGGAEQVLSMLDSALVREGHRSIVVAPEGSKVEGTLVSTPACPKEIDDEARADAQRNFKCAIIKALEKWDIDLVHMHGVDFHSYLPPPGVPVLVTLHLPIEWYSDEALHPWRPRTYLHCVSASQRKTDLAGTRFLPDIENGVPVEKLRLNIKKRCFALSLGRICPEKGFHIALDAASLAGLPLYVAGDVFGYETHRRYFTQEIIPRLEGSRNRFIGSVGFRRKRRLLTAARCLLQPSLVPETSSLSAMEALACGTPVIAFPSGALSEIVEDGKTGFLVRDWEEMAEAIAESVKIDPEACRAAARDRFSSEVMVRRYLEVYKNLVKEKIDQKILYS